LSEVGLGMDDRLLIPQALAQRSLKRWAV